MSEILLVEVDVTGKNFKSVLAEVESSLFSLVFFCSKKLKENFVIPLKKSMFQSMKTCQLKKTPSQQWWYNQHLTATQIISLKKTKLVCLLYIRTPSGDFNWRNSWGEISAFKARNLKKIWVYKKVVGTKVSQIFVKITKVLVWTATNFQPLRDPRFWSHFHYFWTFFMFSKAKSIFFGNFFWLIRSAINPPRAWHWIFGEIVSIFWKFTVFRGKCNLHIWR